MENLIIYVAKACGLIAVFLLAYHLLLKRETFFTSNRWFLLAGLFTAVALPLVVYTQTVWIDPAPVTDSTTQTVTLDQLIQYKQYQQQLAATTGKEVDMLTVDWFDVISGMYLAGVLFFSIRFVLDFLAIRRILSGNVVVRDGRFRLIDSEKARSPFSFFNYIVYNSALLRQEELEGIIVHEKVHSSQKHSFDMIVSQLFCIVFWFNPLVWLYKKSISQNLEFIADAGAMKLMDDKQAYQKTLLKITVQPDCLNLTNQFYQSLIKKRIVMLNKQQSKKVNSWKYAMVLPLLAAFMLLFQVKVVAQEKARAKEPVKIDATNVKVTVEINKDSKDSDLDKSKKDIKEEFDADVNFENVTRNLNKEITGIKVTVKDKGQSQVYEVAGNEPISPFTIELEKDKSGRNQIAFGSGDNNNFVRAQAFRIAANEDLKELLGDSTRVERHRIVRPFVFNSDGMPMPEGLPMEGSVRVKTLNVGDDDMLVVINGVKQKKGEPITLKPGQEIAELNMLKGKEAKKKYGKEAKDGAVEITTKNSHPYQMKMGPEVFSFKMPDDMDFEFDMPMDFDIRIEDFENMPDLNKIFEGNNMMIFGDKLSEEDRIKLKEDLQKAQEEMRQLGPQMRQGFRMKEMSEDEMKKTKEEIEKAKKEIEESRKELEKSRKELEKTRKELNKKA